MGCTLWDMAGTLPQGVLKPSFWTLEGPGVEEVSGVARVRLHLLPQPAHENVVIKLSRADGVRGITLAVYDALGRAVAEPLCNAVLSPGVQQVELDVHTWAAGQ